MKIKKGFALRNIAGCEIVVPVGTASDRSEERRVGKEC